VVTATRLVKSKKESEDQWLDLKISNHNVTIFQTMKLKRDLSKGGGQKKIVKLSSKLSMECRQLSKMAMKPALRNMQRF